MLYASAQLTRELLNAAFMSKLENNSILGNITINKDTPVVNLTHSTSGAWGQIVVDASWMYLGTSGIDVYTSRLFRADGGLQIGASGSFFNATAAGALTISGALSAASISLSGNASIGGTTTLTGNATFTANAYFANGTTYYVDSNANAKFNGLTLVATSSISVPTIAGAKSIYAATNDYIGVKSHENNMWFRNNIGLFTFQSFDDADDWDRSIQLFLPDAGTKNGDNLVFELGQTRSSAAAGSYKGLRITRYNGSAKKDGYLQAGDTVLTGNVGIGMTSVPTTRMQIGDSASIVDEVLTITSTADAGIKIIADTDNATETHNAYIYMAQDNQLVNGVMGFNNAAGKDPLEATYTGAIDNAFLIGVKTVHDLQIGTSATARITVLADGKVGIGTIAPTEELEVNGDIIASGNITVAQINTGNGATEIYDMDQDVKTTDSPTFAGLTLAGTTSAIKNATTGSGSIFTDGQNTNRTTLNFTAVSGSNDPAFIMHETSSYTADVNKAVLHISPSDDNDNVNDYVTIHGTNDPEMIRLYTGGKIWAGSVIVSDSTVTGTQLVSTATAGTAPFSVTSGTVVPTLNVDKVDGYDLDQAILTTSSPTFAGLTLNGSVSINSGEGRGVNFWGSGNYSVYMASSGNATYGGKLDSTSDYNMYLKMTGGTNRGFVFMNGTTPKAQIDASGNLYLAGTLQSGTVPYARLSGTPDVYEKTYLNSVTDDILNNCVASGGTIALHSGLVVKFTEATVAYVAGIRYSFTGVFDSYNSVTLPASTTGIKIIVNSSGILTYSTAPTGDYALLATCDTNTTTVINLVSKINKINVSNGTLNIKNEGAESLTISTTGNVGIGTASPSVKLQVVGDATIGGAVTVDKVVTTNANNWSQFIRNNAGGSALYVNQVNATGDIAAFISGTATAGDTANYVFAVKATTLESSNDLIIKTNGTHSFGEGVRIQAPVATTWARGMYFSSLDGATRMGGIGMYATGDTAGYIYAGFGNTPWASPIFKASSTSVNITKLGIGTDSPGEALHVVGDIQIDGAGGTIGGTTINNAWIKLGTTLGIDSNEIYFANTDGNVGVIGAYNLNFTVNSVTSMIVKSDGKVYLAAGAGINEFSTDGTMSGDSDSAVPTEKAVKAFTYSKGDIETFRNETFDNFTYTGGVVTSKANTALTVTAATGTFYVAGKRFTPAAADKVLTTATTYYIYVNNAGAITSSSTPPSGDYADLATVVVPAATYMVPTTAATVATATTGGTVPAGTFYAKYTWCEGTSWESGLCSTASTAVTTTGTTSTITITVPAFPSGITKAKVYLSTTSGGTYYYQGDVTVSAGSYVRTTAMSTTTAGPTSGTIPPSKITDTRDIITSANGKYTYDLFNDGGTYAQTISSRGAGHGVLIKNKGVSNAFTVHDLDTTLDMFVIDGSGHAAAWNGGVIRAYSDDGTTEQVFMSGATGNIGFTGSLIGKYEISGDRAILQLRDGDGYGAGVALGAGGSTFVGGGESATEVMNNVTVSSEHLYLTADSNINFYTGVNAGWATAKLALTIDSTGLSTFGGNIKLASAGEIHSPYNNAYFIKDHNNGHVTVAATGGNLYLGYTNTVKNLLYAPLYTNDATKLISDVSGKLYYQGTDIDTKYIKVSGTTFGAGVASTAITGATTGSINFSDATIAAGSFATAIHMGTIVSGVGYRQHISIGGYRTGTAWNGGMFVGLGGADANPTEYFLMNLGGEITHSSGKTFWHSGNLTPNQPGAYFGITNTANNTGYGISLYGGAAAVRPDYGLMFAGTPTFGTHGSVNGDWATYFTMNNGAGRGWIFRDVSSPNNVASISNTGAATFNGHLTASGMTVSGATGLSGIFGGNGDAASWNVHNMAIRTWWGLGIRDNNDICRIVFDARIGSMSTQGCIQAGGSGGQQCFQIGDDAGLWDVNQAHSAAIRSTTDNNQGFLYYGGTTGANWIGAYGGAGYALVINSNAAVDIKMNAAAGYFTMTSGMYSGALGTEPGLGVHTGAAFRDGYGVIGWDGKALYKGYARSWTSNSNKAVKENIQPYDVNEGYELLKQLKFYSYSFIEKNPYDYKIGIMAHDAPYVVSDVGGKGHDDANETPNIDLYSYTTLIGTATQALQEKVETQQAIIAEQQAIIAEQQAIIAEQQAKIDAQQAEIDELRRKMEYIASLVLELKGGSI